MVCNDPMISPIVGDRLQFSNPVLTPVTPGGGGICATEATGQPAMNTAARKPNGRDDGYFMELLTLRKSFADLTVGTTFQD